MADPVKDDCQWNGLAGECTPEDLCALCLWDMLFKED